MGEEVLLSTRTRKTVNHYKDKAISSAVESVFGGASVVIGVVVGKLYSWFGCKHSWNNP